MFKHGEALFLSSALIINENGDLKDRILILFPTYLIILAQNSQNTNEFDFELKIPFVNQNTSSIIQLKKVSTLDTVNNSYGGNLTGSSRIVNKYCFELTGLLLQSKLTRFLIVVSSHYDLKMWIDLISNILSKVQFSLNNKSLSTLKSLKTSSTSNIQNGSIKLQQPNKCTSPLTVFTSNNQQRKTFCLRPHPPLIPHFQLPNDIHQGLDSSSTLKRFMYKKPKLSEPHGKCLC